MSETRCSRCGQWHGLVTQCPQYAGVGYAPQLGGAIGIGETRLSTLSYANIPSALDAADALADAIRYHGPNEVRWDDLVALVSAYDAARSSKMK